MEAEKADAVAAEKKAKAEGGMLSSLMQQFNMQVNYKYDRARQDIGYQYCMEGGRRREE